MTGIFLFGAIFMGFALAGLFFFRFWRRTGDRLFLMFALAFGLLALERLALAFVFSGNELKVYLFRLAAFALILIAVVQKNRGTRA
jgi:hypothetical protein